MIIKQVRVSQQAKKYSNPVLKEKQESKIGMSYVDGHYVILSVKKHCLRIFK